LIAEVAVAHLDGSLLRQPGRFLRWRFDRRRQNRRLIFRGGGSAASGWGRARLAQHPGQPASAAYDDVAAEDGDLDVVFGPVSARRRDLLMRRNDGQPTAALPAAWCHVPAAAVHRARQCELEPPTPSTKYPCRARSASSSPEPTLEIIQGYARAIGDLNPLYFDEDYARRSRFGGLIAPPTIHVPLLFLATERTDWMRTPGTINAGQSWYYRRPVRPGDVVTLRGRALDKVYRNERLFVVHDNVFLDDAGRVLCAGRGWTVRPR
jgi:3-hydroxybutyryl-CoA dehydratase